MAIEDVLFAHNVKNGGSVRSVNGRQGDVTITAEELGSAPAEHTHEISEVTGLQSSLELLDTTQEYITDMNRKSVVLSEGTHIVTSETSALADVEIEGRTLTSMANSNLEGSKYYALADAKTKVIVDKKTVAGVGKFQKEQTTKTVADFKGKIEGSTAENPHVFKRQEGHTDLLKPEDFLVELTTSHYQVLVSQLNGGLRVSDTTGLNHRAQHLVSFNVVEQIERELGLIPRETLAEKVEWVKENILGIIINWYGFGTGPSGSGASLTHWNVDTGEWRTDLTRSHNKNSVAMLSRGGLTGSWITTEGITHHLAYAEPSDGVTPSVINTDYISLEIELKSTAQLNTRGKIIRVENFEGKVAGSVVENPHVAMRTTSADVDSYKTLQPPNGIWSEYTSTMYPDLNSLDSNVMSRGLVNEGEIAQTLFSFNLIEAVERNVGKIPASDIAGKVAWLRKNIARLTGSWYGFGSSPNGNRATLVMWRNGRWSLTAPSTAANFVKRVDIESYPHYSENNINLNLGDDGFIHFLVYAEPSDGVTPSIINTDYIELEIELKPTADFHAPHVPLYEVTKDEYDKIGIVWDEAEVKRRYPVVEGTQHLVNPYVMAEGDNLLPPFTEWAMDEPEEVTIESPYRISWYKADWDVISFETKLTPNSTYKLNVHYIGRMRLELKKRTGEYISLHVDSTTVDSSNGRHFDIETTSDSEAVRIQFFNHVDNPELYVENPMLSLGTEPKQFVPRNPSYLYVQERLGAVGDKKDVLFKENGKWKVRKVMESTELDSSKDWAHASAQPTENTLKNVWANGLVQNYNLATFLFGSSGNSLKNEVDFGKYGSDTTILRLTVNNSLSGFGSSFTPSSSDWKRYFNGWKYSDGITWTSVTGNGQTATAQEALDTQPTEYTPYKLNYVLAEPVVEEVEVEGQIKVDGVTQLEVGSGIVAREKVTPAYIADYKQFYINRIILPESKFDFPTKNILSVYKNNDLDTRWTKVSDDAYQGGQGAWIPEENFDPTAEYTVTYLAEKPTFTNAPTHTKLTYANSIRASFQDVVAQVEDTSTQVSVDSKFLLDMLVQLKAMRG